MLRLTKTENGLVRGFPGTDARITVFKGIPFAADPIGENRWKAPQPAENWEGVRDCYEFAPITMQATPGKDPEAFYSKEWHVDSEIAMSEKGSLCVNVWTPAKSADEKLPVFVWYFGGGLREGNPAEMEFDGERIARRGIVVVTINYRVNVFGFLTHPELVAQQPDNCGNFGYLDQQFATRWVKENIAVFGGDPENITIGGQSAGGGSVCAQLAADSNAGLFQKAIIMSSFAADVYKNRNMSLSFEDAQKQGVEFFKFLGVETLEEARKLDAFYIRDKYAEFGGMWRPVVEGYFFDDEPLKKVTTGRRHKVPLMVGCTVGETKPGLAAAKDFDDIKAMADKAFGDKADEFMALLGDDFDAAVAKTVIPPSQISVRAMKENEKELGLDLTTYYYKFNPEFPGWDNPGTFHSSDLWFYFETLAKCWRPFVGKHYDLSRQMCNAWANFFKCGDPNGLDADGTPMVTWKPYTLEDNDVMFWGDKAEAIKDEPSDVMNFLVDYYRNELK